MVQVLLVLAAALTVAAVVFGIAVLLTGDRHGLRPVEPDSRAVPLPVDRPLVEPDLDRVRFDTALRGYRMAQVDTALRRTAYDIGYKDELIKVLQAEIVALREGRFPDAEVLRRAREAAAVPGAAGDPSSEPPPEALADDAGTAASETTASETGHSETTASETTASETGASETGAPESDGAAAGGAPAPGVR